MQVPECGTRAAKAHDGMRTGANYYLKFDNVAPVAQNFGAP